MINFEMVKGLIERYTASAVLVVVLWLGLPEAWAGPTAEIAIVVLVVLAQTFFGVKLNTQSSLVHAANVAVAKTDTASPEVAKVAAETAKELKAKVE